MAEDYYKILGVAKDADKDQLKKAFRKLAMKYHPDRNKGDKAAEERFKKANEAYAVLSDKKKRQQYDMFGADGFSQRFSREDIFRGADFGNIFKEFGFGNGEDILSRLFGGSFGQQSRPGSFSFFSSGAGAQGSPFGQPGESCSRKAHYSAGAHQPSGQDMVCDMTISFMEAVQGGQRTLTLKHQAGQQQVKVKIPAGIKEGQRLRVSGKGIGVGAGNLYIKIKIAPHPIFTREGDDVYVEKEVLPSQAMLGGTIEVPTLNGNKRLKLPPGSSSGRKIRLKGCGIKRLKGGGHGDLYVRLAIKVPAKLSVRQKKLAQELAQEGL